MPIDFQLFGVLPILPSLAAGDNLSATALPFALTNTDATRVIADIPMSFEDPDLRTESTALWVVDRSAQFGPRPSVDHMYILRDEHGKWGLKSAEYHMLKAGRDADRANVILPDKYISRLHLILLLFPGLVSVINVSERNPVYAGGRRLDPGQKIGIVPNAPFLVGFDKPVSRTDGSILLSPADAIFNGAFEMAAPAMPPYRRIPWRKMAFVAQREPARARTPNEAPDAITPQNIAEGGNFVTPPQIRNIDRLLAPGSPPGLDRTGGKLPEESALIRTSIRAWLSRGRLDAHVRGQNKLSERLLANVRNGGMLLPTHSTSLKAAAAILKSGTIDPQFSHRHKAFFRYGLGHSYGEVVFVQRPGTEKLGRLRDIWDVIKNLEKAPEELYELVTKVDYNRDVPLKADREPKPAEDEKSILADAGRFEGRTHFMPDFENHALMEIFPQFESFVPVSIENTCAILVPEHLYDELAKLTPPHRRDLLIRIPGTGRREKDFLAGRDRVARRSRKDGGSFVPEIGYNALYRYELTYFKIVETVQRMRHRSLRQKIEELADNVAAGKLSHSDIVAQISEAVPLLPEAFRLLHRQKQFDSHDGLSPLEHILNTLVEASYLAPALAKEFSSIHFRDAFIALLYHDLGKMFGARKPDHDSQSIRLAGHHLKIMGIGVETEGERTRQKRILEFIEHAGLISEVSMALDRGDDLQTTIARVRPLIGPNLPNLFLMNFADVAAIPGRSGRQMQINKGYTPIDVRSNMIRAFRSLSL